MLRHRHRLSQCVCVAFTCITLLGQFAAAASSGRTFTLDNRSDVGIMFVYAGPDYVDEWGDDLLEDSVQAERSQRQFHISAADGHCMFDVRAVSSNGFTRSFMGIDLCEEDRLVFNGGHALLVKNRSETAILTLKMAPDFEDGWGDDRLGYEVINAGDEYVAMIDGHSGHCVFDIRLDTSEDVVEYRDRNLCDDQTITFYEGNELAVVNETEKSVVYIRVSIDHESQGWGDDLLAAGILSGGSEGTVRTRHFDGEQCVFDVLMQDEDRQSHVYEDVNICANDRLVFPPGAGSPPPPPPDDLTVGETFRDCEDWGCPWMVVVDGGTYERGSLNHDDEAPVRRVTVPGPFAVGEFEVTVAQFDEFASETGYEGGRGCYIKQGSRWRWADGMDWHNPGFAQSDGHPAVCVSWEDATAYTTWLRDRTGLPYRLLTEAEWEFLARRSINSFDRSGKANCRGCGSNWDGKSTAPAGRFGADRHGVSDLFGNAGEWVQDCYQSGYSNAPRDGSAWLPQSCKQRVVRGGSWYTRASNLRASGRDRAELGRRNSSVGFRVARGLSP